MPDDRLINELKQVRASVRIAKRQFARTVHTRINEHEVAALDVRCALNGLMDASNALDRLVASEEGS